jgi:hypothetical protein
MWNSTLARAADAHNASNTNCGTEPNFSPKRLKRKFTAEEDHFLGELVQEHGTEAWTFVARFMGTRTPRQCRDRYDNYLNPTLRSDPNELVGLTN